MKTAASIRESAPAEFELTGPLTVITVADLRQRGLQLFERTAAATQTVDLRAVTVADSAGLALLIDWLSWARSNARDLQFRNLPAALVALAGLSEVGELLQPAIAQP